MLVGLGQSSNILYHSLKEDFSIVGRDCEHGVGPSTFFARRLRKLGPTTVMGQLLFMGAIAPLLRLGSRQRAQQIMAQNHLDTSPIPLRRLIPVDSVNSDATRATLRRLAPQIVIVNGTRIIEERTLNCVDATFINTHLGITPLYRGVHGGYWALASGDPQHCGVTVHRVDKGIDTGSILGQAVITPQAQDTLVTYPLLQVAAAIPLLKQAVLDSLAGKLPPAAPPAGKSRLWTHPTARQYIRNRRAGVR